MADLVDELLEFVDDVVDELGCRQEVAYAETIVREGTSADRQLAVFEATGSLHAVVDSIAAETVEGLTGSAARARSGLSFRPRPHASPRQVRDLRPAGAATSWPVAGPRRVVAPDVEAA